MGIGLEDADCMIDGSLVTGTYNTTLESLVCQVAPLANMTILEVATVAFDGPLNKTSGNILIEIDNLGTPEILEKDLTT